MDYNRDLHEELTIDRLERLKAQGYTFLESKGEIEPSDPLGCTWYLFTPRRIAYPDGYDIDDPFLAHFAGTPDKIELFITKDY